MFQNREKLHLNIRKLIALNIKEEQRGGGGEIFVHNIFILDLLFLTHLICNSLFKYQLLPNCITIIV